VENVTFVETKQSTTIVNLSSQELPFVLISQQISKTSICLTFHSPSFPAHLSQTGEEPVKVSLTARFRSTCD
jgi:hypothetical protein